MFRFLFVSTLMVSTSFTAFAMNSGNLPPQGGDQKVNKGKTIVSLGGVSKVVLADDVRKPLRSSSGLGTLVMERRLPHVKSSPDLLNEEVDFSKTQPKAVSESGEKLVHTRSLSFSSSSSSSSSSSVSSSSSSSSASSSSNSLSSYSSNNLPQVFLASHATCALATTSTSSSALAEEDSVTHATSSTEKSLTTSVLATNSNSLSALPEEESVTHAKSSSEKRLAFKSAIKALPAHLRTDSLKSEYKELRKRFRTAVFIQSLAWFPEGNVKELKEFLWGLPELPQNITADDLVTFVNTVHSSFLDNNRRVTYLDKGLESLIQGKSMRFVFDAIRQHTDL